MTPQEIQWAALCLYAAVGVVLPAITIIDYFKSWRGK